MLDPNTFVSPALVRIGRIIKGAVVGQMESVVMDKHKPLYTFSNGIFNLLFANEKKIDVLIFYGTIDGQGQCLNCNLSLNDYRFDEQKDFLGVLPESTFITRALTDDVRILLLSAAIQGNINWRRSKSGKVKTSFALMTDSHLYICNSKKKDANQVYAEFKFVVLLDYCDFQEHDGQFKIERVQEFNVHKEKELYISTASTKLDFMWSSALRKHCRNTWFTCVMGASLDTLVSRDPQGGLPGILTNAINYFDASLLSTDDLFKKTAPESELYKVLNTINEQGLFDAGSIKNPHLVCDVLKMWLALLPRPLLNPYAQFMKIAEGNYEENQELFIDQVFSLIKSLPHHDALALQALCAFLYKVSTYSSENRCTIRSLAQVFGPLVLRAGPVDEERLADKTLLISVIIDNHQDLAAIIKSSALALSTEKETKRQEREAILMQSLMERKDEDEPDSEPSKSKFYTKRRSKASSVTTNATHLARDLEMESLGQRLDTLEQLLMVEVEIRKLTETKLRREEQLSEHLESELRTLRQELQDVRRIVNGLANQSPPKELSALKTSKKLPFEDNLDLEQLESKLKELKGKEEQYQLTIKSPRHLTSRSSFRVDAPNGSVTPHSPKKIVIDSVPTGNSTARENDRLKSNKLGSSRLHIMLPDEPLPISHDSKQDKDQQLSPKRSSRDVYKGTEKPKHTG